MGNKLFKHTKPQFYFRLMDGSELRSVHEFAQSLSRMSEDVFYSHLNENKNDFSAWVRDVFDEQELADKLAQCRNMQQTELTVLRHLLHQKSKDA